MRKFTIQISYVNAVGQYDITFPTIVRDFTKKEPSGLEFSDPQLQMYERSSVDITIKRLTFI